MPRYSWSCNPVSEETCLASIARWPGSRAPWAGTRSSNMQASEGQRLSARFGDYILDIARWTNHIEEGTREADMITQKQTLKNLTIQLDGGTFVGCTFESCELVFNGLMGATFVNCTFGKNIKWRFAGPASNTIDFMKALYQSGGGELIENTFRQIRGENLEPGTTLQ